MLNKLTTTLIGTFLLLVASPGFAEPASQSGKVAEVINVKSYTYLRLENGVWVATTPLNIAEGDLVKFSGGMEMPNFHSKVLNRTFKSVIFVQNVNLVRQDSEKKPTAEKKPSEHGSVTRNHTGQLQIEAPTAGEIVPLVDGKSIADIFKMSASLKTQTVKLRAKVMKVNQNIMGKNWITLQDGSGDENNNKLLVTSSETVSPGDLVVVSGVLMTDVDLGFGYKYKVLLENASFQ